MERKFKTTKILSLVLSITFLFSLFVIPQAKLNAKPNFGDENISTLLFQKHKTVIPLYSTDGALIAIYLSNGNDYCILNSENYEIIEMSDEHNIEFIEQANKNTKKVIYSSPLNYYSKSSSGELQNQFNEVITDNLVQAVNFKDLAKKESTIFEKQNFKFNNSSTMASPKFGIYDYFVSSSNLIPNYSYNPNGICGSTAAAMLLMYFDKRDNNNYVPANLESSDGVKLIKTLMPLIDGTNPGSGYNELVNGLNNYLSRNGFSRTSYKRSDFSLNLNYGPAILGLTRHPKYKEHWTVAYGYKEYNNIMPYSNVSSLNAYANGQNSYYVFYLVIDGWGNKGVQINPKYSDGAVYLKWKN